MNSEYQTPHPDPLSCPRGGTLGRWGWFRWSKKIKHGHVAYQIEGDDEQNRMQETFSSLGQTDDLERGQKVKYHLHVNFKDFYTKLCVCSHI